MSIKPSSVVLKAGGVAELVALVEMCRNVCLENNDNPGVVKHLGILSKAISNKHLLTFNELSRLNEAAATEAYGPTTRLNEAAWLERAEAREGEDAVARLDMNALLAAMFNKAAQKQPGKSKGRS